MIARVAAHPTSKTDELVESVTLGEQVLVTGQLQVLAVPTTGCLTRLCFVVSNVHGPSHSLPVPVGDPDRCLYQQPSTPFPFQVSTPIWHEFSRSHLMSIDHQILHESDALAHSLADALALAPLESLQSLRLVLLLVYVRRQAGTPTVISLIHS